MTTASSCAISSSTSGRPLTIGVLALQGAFIEHVHILKRLNFGQESNVVLIKQPNTQLDPDVVHGLIIPGGESSTLSVLCEQLDCWDAIDRYIRVRPTWGICAGLILLASNPHLSHGLNVTVERNAFGPQLFSFVQPSVKFMGLWDVEGVFIRAPAIQSVGDGVKVLATIPKTTLQSGGLVVAVQQDHLLGTCFHPELTNDHRIHEYFVKLVAAHRL